METKNISRRRLLLIYARTLLTSSVVLEKRVELFMLPIFYVLQIFCALFDLFFGCLSVKNLILAVFRSNNRMYVLLLYLPQRNVKRLVSLK